jgi:DNA/RNA-binding domain of Phe-tRNA-synthetase-like protein
MIEPSLKSRYPHLKTGYFTVKNIKDKAFDGRLEEKKREIEGLIRAKYQDLEKTTLFEDYDSYFKAFGGTYPVRYQIKSILSGKSIPSRSCILEAMFMAELKNGILTAGHDLDRIQGRLTTSLSSGGQSYLSISGKTLDLPAGDIFTSDEKGIISTISIGPDQRTKITAASCNLLFFSYAFEKVSAQQLANHLNEIKEYIQLFADTKLEISEIIVE